MADPVCEQTEDIALDRLNFTCDRLRQPMRRCRTTFAAVILLMVALTPAVTVVCVSSQGHLQLESLLASCCGALPNTQEPARQGSVGSVAGCSNCSDLPLLSTAELPDLRLCLADNQVWSSLVPSDLTAETSSLTALASHAGILLVSAANTSSSSPLRC